MVQVECSVLSAVNRLRRFFRILFNEYPSAILVRPSQITGSTSRCRPARPLRPSTCTRSRRLQQSWRTAKSAKSRSPFDCLQPNSMPPLQRRRCPVDAQAGSGRHIPRPGSRGSAIAVGRSISATRPGWHHQPRRAVEEFPRARNERPLLWRSVSTARFIRAVFCRIGARWMQIRSYALP